MKSLMLFRLRQFWNALGTPLPTQVRWVRHTLLSRIIDRWQTGTRADVSVIIPCHNYGHLLTEAVESVLRQTVKPHEILIVDDASDDDTAAVADRFSVKGVSYLRVAHRDLAATRNSAAAATKGRFLLYLDADDRLPPDYIERCLEHAEDTRVGLIYGDIQYFNESSTYVMSPDFDEGTLNRYNFITSNALIRRKAFDLVGGYRSIPHSMEDWDFHRRVVTNGFTGAKAHTFLWYNVHKGSMMHRHKESGHASYEKEAALVHHPMTVFTVFTDTSIDIDIYMQRLLAGGFPPAMLQLYWYNTVADPAFDTLLRKKMAEMHVGSVQYVHAPEEAQAPFEQDTRMIRAWHAMIRSSAAAYVLSLSPTYPLPPNGILSLLKPLRQDLVAVFAPCHVCGNEVRSEETTADHPCFCCALIRTGKLRAIMPLSTAVDEKASGSFEHLTYRQLRQGGYFAHISDTLHQPSLFQKKDTVA